MQPLPRRRCPPTHRTTDGGPTSGNRSGRRRSGHRRRRPAAVGELEVRLVAAEAATAGAEAAPLVGLDGAHATAERADAAGGERVTERGDRVLVRAAADVQLGEQGVVTSSTAAAPARAPPPRRRCGRRGRAGGRERDAQCRRRDGAARVVASACRGGGRAGHRAGGARDGRGCRRARRAPKRAARRAPLGALVPCRSARRRG